jgi:hypothetical protein
MKPDEMSIVDKVTINEATIDEVSSTRHMAIDNAFYKHLN